MKPRRPGEFGLRDALQGRVEGQADVVAGLEPRVEFALEPLQAVQAVGLLGLGLAVTTARAVAQRLGIDEVHGEVKPADKLELVEKLQAEGRRGAGQRVAQVGRHQRAAALHGLQRAPLVQVLPPGAGTPAVVVKPDTFTTAEQALGKALAPKEVDKLKEGDVIRVKVLEVDVARKRIGLTSSEKLPVREGAKLVDADGQEVGVVSSGTLGPTVGHLVAMGYVNAAQAAVGTNLFALVRDKKVAMTVATMPFAPHRYFRG